jgi:hypothetical protein
MSEERFRIEGIPGGDSLHVIHENLELSDTDGLVLVSWTVNFPNPVMGSVDLLQVEARPTRCRIRNGDGGRPDGGASSAITR